MNRSVTPIPLHEAGVPVAVVERSGIVEGVHHGAAVVVDSSGAVVASAGDPSVPVYARSAMKPFQAHAMTAAGLELPDDLLALVCSSHDGAPTHVDGVRRILASAGLDESALRTTPALPFDRDEADAIVRAGGGATAITMNCSGKHAGMLATCVSAGWPTEGHLDADHPLQVWLTRSIARDVGPVHHLGVDGCGAPAHVVPLVDLARGMGRLAASSAPVVMAMRRHPEMVGGPARAVTRMMRAVDGLVAKDGAEGVMVAALPGGAALAVKVLDGASRAATPVAVSLLVDAGVDVAVVERLAAEVGPPVLGHGRPVGSVRSLVGHTGS